MKHFFLAFVVVAVTNLFAGCDDVPRSSRPANSAAGNYLDDRGTDVWGVTIEFSEFEGLAQGRSGPEQAFDENGALVSESTVLIFGKTVTRVVRTSDGQMTFTVNERDYGTIQVGDRVFFAMDGEVRVNGLKRAPL